MKIKINIMTNLELFLQLHNFWKVNDAALHRIKALDDNQDLLPRSVGTWLTLRDNLAQELTQVIHVIVLEDADGRARKASAKDNGGVVVLIADNEAALRWWWDSWIAKHAECEKVFVKR